MNGPELRLIQPLDQPSRDLQGSWAQRGSRCAEQAIDRDGSLAAFLWRHEPAAEELAEPQTASTSPASIALSEQLRKQGWKFVGPATVSGSCGATVPSAPNRSGRARTRSASISLAPRAGGTASSAR